MSSIFELFGDPELAGDDAGGVFDPSSLDEVLNKALANRPVAGRPDGFMPGEPGSALPSPDGEVQGNEGGTVQGTAASVPPETPPPPPPPAPPPPSVEPVTPPAAVDPFGNLTDMERLELAQLRQALGDPDRALAVRRAMFGVEGAPPTPVASVVPAAPPAPTLPEDIDPGSFEAQLWNQNQEMMAELRSLKQGQQASAEQTEQERMNGAAQRSTQAFVARYGSKLSPEEIQAIAQHAGLQKLPEAFRPVSNSWDEAMDKSLEFTLRSNDGILAKVLGAAPPPAPVAQPAALDPNKRKLTALSSAATPSGEAAQRTPIEVNKNNGGKMTEKSRLALVQEMMSGGSITGTPGEGI